MGRGGRGEEGPWGGGNVGRRGRREGGLSDQKPSEPQGLRRKGNGTLTPCAPHIQTVISFSGKEG